MKNLLIWLGLGLGALINDGFAQLQKPEPKHLTQLNQVKHTVINDPFWNPKFALWSTTTATDVLDKFEGKHLHRPDGANSSLGRQWRISPLSA